MALTLTKEPIMFTPVPVRNNLQIQMETDKYLITAGSKAKREFIFSHATGAAIIDGDFMKFSMDGVEYTFTFKNTPDDSGYQLPLKGAMSNADWMAAVKTALESCPYVHENLDMNCYADIPAYFFIIFTGKKNGTPILTSGGSSSFGSSGAINAGALDTYNENFTNNLKLYCEQNFATGDFLKLVDMYDFPKNVPDGDTPHFLSDFRIDKALYDFMEKTYSENLAEALPYTANYPIAKHLLKKFYWRYFESYGTPAVDRMYNLSETKIAWLGGFGHMNYITQKYINGFYLLHPSGSIDNPVSLHQYVDKDQPAWLYFIFSPNDGNEVGSITGINMKIYYSDGTDNTVTFTSVPAFAVPNNNTKAFFIPVGYNQRTVGYADTPTAKAYKWDINIIIDGDDVVLRKTFILECCNSYKSFLMYQNSLGGYDTVAITAPKEFGLDIAEGKEVERILGDDYAIHDSQFEGSEPKARQTVKCNIGFKKAIDYDVLKELLTSKHVFLLPKGTEEVFIPVNIDRKSVTLESEDDFERNFAFEFAPAHEFKNFENNLWLR